MNTMVRASGVLFGLSLALGGAASPALADDSIANIFGTIPSCPFVTTGFSYVYCDPTVSLSAGLMDMQRGKSEGVIITPGSGPGTILDASQYSYKWVARPEIQGSWQIWNGFGVEARYFSTEDSSSALIPSLTTFRTDGIGVTILGSGSVTTQSVTALHSVEANATKEIFGGLTLIGGIRRVELSDSINMQITSPEIFNNWVESNILNGVQGGAKFAFLAPVIPLELDITGKSGVYTNNASNTFASAIVGAAQDAAKQRSTVSEVDLTATYHLGQHLGLQAGYTALWLNNVALAGARGQQHDADCRGHFEPVKKWQSHVQRCDYRGRNLFLSCDWASIEAASVAGADSIGAGVLF